MLSAWIPRTTPVSVGERARSAAGALVGILVTGLVSRLAVGAGSSLPILIAPMGASAVLLFAVPASPLAQPWSLIGGNLIAATVGVSAAMMIANPFVAAAFAVGASIALMMSCRCVHPPSGAVALTAVLGGSAIRDLGMGFVLWPVAANSILLLGVAVLFNNLFGRSYPHRAVVERPQQPASETAPVARIGITGADIDAVLAEYDQLMDVDRDDLEAIIHQAEIRSYRRRSGFATCGAVMSRDIIAVAPYTSLAEALELLRTHHVKVLPVTDDRARVLGVVTQTDLLDKSVWSQRGPRVGTARRIRLSLARGRAPHGTVEDIMTAPVVSATPEMILADVVRLMGRTGLHHLPVVQANGKLCGVVAQSDLLVALLAEGAHAREQLDISHGGSLATA